MSCSPEAGARSRAYIQVFPSRCFGSPIVASTSFSVMPTLIFLNCLAREASVGLETVTFSPEALVQVQACVWPERRIQHKSARNGLLRVICCGFSQCYWRFSQRDGVSLGQLRCVFVKETKQP